MVEHGDAAPWLERFRAGEALLFTQFVRQHQAALLWFVEGRLHGTGRADAALDITQETFLKLYANRAQIRDETHARCFLYRVAVNLASNHRRTCRGRRERSLEHFIGPDRDGCDLARLVQGPDKGSIHAEEREQLNRALEQLAPDLREVLFLRYYEGLPQNEIARVMNKSTPTISRWLRQGRDALRTILEVGP
jgi:RNA polymerase sigma-70 factor (ECF subfamily)